MNSFSSELNRYPDGNAYELKEAISKNTMWIQIK